MRTSIRANYADREARGLRAEARAERILGAYDLADWLEYQAECKARQADAMEQTLLQSMQSHNADQSAA